MESPSQAPHSGGSPWKGLLLTASILSSWIQPTSAQGASVTVVPNPPYGTVGSSVILDIQGISEQPSSYTWHKRTVGNQIAFYRVADGHLSTADNRLNMFSNGSLLISNLRLNDTDNYLVQYYNSTSLQIERAEGYFVVYGLLSTPTINSTNMAPVENKDTVSLTCQSDSQDVTDLVWFINQSSPVGDRIVLSPNNKTLTIISVTREDQGPYESEIWNPISRNRSEPFTLNITYGPNPPIIVPIDPNYPVGATLELSCSADSNPLAQYTWLFNGVERTSTPQLSIPDVSLNHTGTCTCIASNSVTGLSSSKDINITISERVSKPTITANLSVSKDVTVSVEKVSPGRGNGSSFSTGDIAGIVIGVLVGVALTGGLIYFFFFKETGRASKHCHSEKNCSAPKHGEDTTLYENTACEKGSAVSAQGLDSSPAFPQVQSESPYQVLDISQVDVYEKISPWKNPQAEGREKSP